MGGPTLQLELGMAKRGMEHRCPLYAFLMCAHRSLLAMSRERQKVLYVVCYVTFLFFRRVVVDGVEDKRPGARSEPL